MTKLQISQNYKARVTLKIIVHMASSMISHRIPIQNFWDIIFSPAGSHYLNRRGSIPGDLIESSTSMSATLSDLHINMNTLDLVQMALLVIY